jgi:hypothetical protein
MSQSSYWRTALLSNKPSNKLLNLINQPQVNSLLSDRSAAIEVEGIAGIFCWPISLLQGSHHLTLDRV